MINSPTVRSAVAYGLSGLGFSAGNLLLARSLPPAEYGQIALFLALIHFAIPIAPLGLDMLIIRNRTRPEKKELLKVLASGLLLGLAGGGLAAAFYGMSTAVALTIALCVAFGGANWVAAATYQSRQRLAPSLLLTQNQNFLLLAIGLALLFGAPPAGATVVAVITLGFLVSAMLGWARLPGPVDGRRPLAMPSRESMALVGVAAADMLLTQLDRLLIPLLLSMHDLAVYAVLAATIVAPFRVLQLAAAFAVAPKISAAANATQRKQVLLAEARYILPIVLLSAAAVWWLAPPVISLFVGDKYEITASLMLAGIAAGIAKVASSFTSAAVAAVAPPEILARMTGISWIAVPAAIAIAALLAEYGVAGVVYGVAAGWMFKALAATALLPRSLRNTPDAHA